MITRTPPRLLTRKAKPEEPEAVRGTTIYFDTEFSNLTKTAQLISLGAVTQSGEEFYAEIEPRPERCSAFVKDTVFPLLTGPKLSTQAFIDSFSCWLTQFDHPVLLSGDTWDIFVLRGLVEGQAHHRAGPLVLPGPLGQKLSMMTIPTLGDDAKARFDIAIDQHFAHDPRRHHSLVDANALRAGMLALKSGSES
jgi:hypothetical protein